MDFNEKLVDALNLIGLKHDDIQLQNFRLFYDELIEYNKKINLTTIIDEDGFIYKHILDSLVPYKILENNNKILDIGAGAGFPSVPLSIILNDANITAIDSVNKKILWLERIKNMAKLSHFYPIHTRCEDLAFKEGFRESFDVVVSRAVAELNTLLEYAIPFVKVGGLFLAYKSVGVDEELRNAKSAISILGCKLIDKIEFNNEKLGNRVILVFKKITKTQNKYPRGMNKPRLNPIKWIYIFCTSCLPYILHKLSLIHFILVLDSLKACFEVY